MKPGPCAAGRASVAPFLVGGYFFTSNSASITSSFLPPPAAGGTAAGPAPSAAGARWTCWAMAWAAGCRLLSACWMAFTSLPLGGLLEPSRWPTCIGALSPSESLSPFSFSSLLDLPDRLVGLVAGVGQLASSSCPRRRATRRRGASSRPRPCSGRSSFRCGSSLPCRSPCPWPTRCRMPLASMSKVTSICGMPRGAGGDAVQVELAEQAVVGRHRRVRPGRPGP